MKRQDSLLVLLGTAVMLSCGISARADSVAVSATYTGDSPTQTVGINSAYLAPPYNVNGGTFYAGASNFTVTSVTNTGNYSTDLDTTKVAEKLGTNFVGFCIDLDHLISAPTPHTWDVAYLDSVTTPINGFGISDPQQTAIKFLWGTHAAAAVGDGADAATFQMALWDLLYNPPYAVGSTGVTFSGNGNIGTAANWASDAWGGIGTSTDVYALIARPDDAQSFSVAIVGAETQTTAVPLPASAGVGFSMLGGFGAIFAFRKRFGRKSRIA